VITANVLFESCGNITWTVKMMVSNRHCVQSAQPKHGMTCSHCVAPLRGGKQLKHTLEGTFLPAEHCRNTDMWQIKGQNSIQCVIRVWGQNSFDASWHWFCKSVWCFNDGGGESCNYVSPKLLTGQMDANLVSKMPPQHKRADRTTNCRGNCSEFSFNLSPVFLKKGLLLVLDPALQ